MSPGETIASPQATEWKWGGRKEEEEEEDDEEEGEEHEEEEVKEGEEGRRRGLTGGRGGGRGVWRAKGIKFILFSDDFRLNLLYEFIRRTVGVQCNLEVSPGTDGTRMEHRSL